ncbi:hypothetical protein J3Q64DRAFT_1826270 [Phycomyces blakesleeanus]|uniref:Secreted protein n=1 Tax=Phycomyces blakesleeanus TaxID=4837 RepID=A0ABR3AIL6_PHYBL
MYLISAKVLVTIVWTLATRTCRGLRNSGLHPVAFIDALTRYEVWAVLLKVQICSDILRYWITYKSKEQSSLYLYLRFIFVVLNFVYLSLKTDWDMRGSLKETYLIAIKASTDKILLACSLEIIDPENCREYVFWFFKVGIRHDNDNTKQVYTL